LLLYPSRADTPGTQGINDNGSGSIGILELALNLRQYSIPNAVRFSWWAAEEDGDVGSTEYVAGLSDEELAKIALYLNFDMIGSTNAGHLVFDPDCSFAEVPEECPSPGVVHIRNTFQRYYNRTARIPTGTSDWGGASDYQPFLDAGIPAGYLSTGADEIITAEQALWYVFLHPLCAASLTLSKVGKDCRHGVRPLLSSALRFDHQPERGRVGHCHKGCGVRSGDVCQLCGGSPRSGSEWTHSFLA